MDKKKSYLVIILLILTLITVGCTDNSLEPGGDDNGSIEICTAVDFGPKFNTTDDHPVISLDNDGSYDISSLKPKPLVKGSSIDLRFRYNKLDMNGAYFQVELEDCYYDMKFDETPLQKNGLLIFPFSLKGDPGVNEIKLLFRLYNTEEEYRSIRNELTIKVVDSDEVPAPELEKGSIQDIDGNTYKTVKIGNQWWMAENLRTSSLNDGTPIPNIESFAIYKELEAPAYSWYLNDSVKYSDPYGPLYNDFVVSTEKVCPTGWHVPSNFEWQELFEFISEDNGGYEKDPDINENGEDEWEKIGDHLKSRYGWNQNVDLNVHGWENGNGTDDYGFSALPAGERTNRDFRDIGEYTSFHSSSNWGYGKHYNMNLYDDSGNVRFHNVESSSIRCVKDE